MKHFIILLLLGTFCSNLSAQATYEEFQSQKLGETRGLKIQLPRNYDPDAKREYPLVLVLDGDYLFEPVAGNVDYQAYWEDIPDCIVVGVKQNNSREDDFYYSEDDYFPAESGASFYEFIAGELIPYINKNYNTSDFRIIVGHDMAANFSNYFLFKNPPLFRAYIELSPDFAPEMVSRLEQRLPGLEQEIFYYMATADGDLRALKSNIEECHAKLEKLESEKLNYKFDNFEDANHYSLVGRGIPKALNQIFEMYKPINAKEYQEKVLTYEGSPYEYLIKKYEKIEYFYGFKKEIIENDIRAIAAASNKKEDLESLENLAKLVKKNFPNSMLRSYYMGMFHEKAGNLKKALHEYQSGLLLEPSQYIDKDLMLDKMYDAKEALND